MDWKPNAFQVPATLSQTIYQSLKKAIIDGELKPGQRLQEKEIAALYNTSSTPVREAFFRLAAEKYLVISARKEVLVQDTSQEEVRELYEIVRALDILALRKSLVRMGDADVEELRAMTDELGRLYSAGGHQGYLDQNLRIHDRIWSHCGSASLYRTLSDLMAKIAIYRRKVDFAPFSDPPALEKSYRDHCEIFRLVERRDIDALERLIEAHWGEEFSIDTPPAPKRGPDARR
ncbi:MAG TPA: GntR family transcriptional regulator [Candidatus Aminicenantes bacterium]|nr:GntR family transcriptional regulator [Candidatus Aminicenantes bacterium]HRY63908.1 GntR family transcriptional regulator [Candidatus Aminicenantes bacterium]HRZ70821.1 GntR family transcriptional regulator [Candidatus Aminicenantes bacterium]